MEPALASRAAMQQSPRPRSVAALLQPDLLELWRYAMAEARSALEAGGIPG